VPRTAEGDAGDRSGHVRPFRWGVGVVAVHAVVRAAATESQPLPGLCRMSIGQEAHIIAGTASVLGKVCTATTEQLGASCGGATRSRA
jgi:hypothetical protein